MTKYVLHIFLLHYSCCCIFHVGCLFFIISMENNCTHTRGLHIHPGFTPIRQKRSTVKLFCLFGRCCVLHPLFCNYQSILKRWDASTRHKLAIEGTCTAQKPAAPAACGRDVSPRYLDRCDQLVRTVDAWLDKWRQEMKSAHLWQLRMKLWLEKWPRSIQQFLQAGPVGCIFYKISVYCVKKDLSYTNSFEGTGVRWGPISKACVELIILSAGTRV